MTALAGSNNAAIGQDPLDGDPIVKALERSTIAQTLKAARASLAEPSRPFTPLDRSLFQMPDSGDASRPTSGYTVDQLSFVRDTYGGRPDSARSSRTGRYETICEEYEDYHHSGGADILRLVDDEPGVRIPERQRSPPDSEVGGGDDSSDSEELTPMTPSEVNPAPPTMRTQARPPRPPAGGYPSGAAVAAAVRSAGGYPDNVLQVADASPHRRSSSKHKSPHRRRMADASPSRRKASPSPAGRAGGSTASSSPPPDSPTCDWDAGCQAVIAKLQALAESEEKRRKNPDLLTQMCEGVWDLTVDIKAGRGQNSSHHAVKLLRAVLGLMDIKDSTCLFKLSRCALALLQMEGATQGVSSSGVQAAYLNIAKVLFKCSKNEGHDGYFLKEGLLVPILEVLQAHAQHCSSNDLRVYIVGILKNISHNDANQKCLVQRGAVDVFFRLMDNEQLMGNSKEAQLLIQVTATLRNLAGQQYKLFLSEDKLNALTRISALFPGQVELLTNISRILAKLTLHSSACEALAKTDVHIRQMARTLSANVDAAPLVLRFSFVLGNLTAKSDRLRKVFAFDCEGTALVPQLLGIYWQKERQLARIELEKGQATACQEIEEVLVKLVRLLANMAISAAAGATLASSSAVVDPLLDMLGAKRISDSEELVLNVVAAITNLLFYNVPSNILFQEENKQLLCRLFRPLLLESYNVEALIETTRALGNLSRHSDARTCMTGLRIDEILVIILDHDDRDLVFYVCGALVNLAADPECNQRLMGTCPAVQKLGQLLGDALPDDMALQLVAVKVLTNLSLDPGSQWMESSVQALRAGLHNVLARCENGKHVVDSSAAAGDRQQLIELAQHLLGKLPQESSENVLDDVGPDHGSRSFWCEVPGCGRQFDTQAKLNSHTERRHGKESKFSRGAVGA